MHSLTSSPASSPSRSFHSSPSSSSTLHSPIPFTLFSPQASPRISNGNSTLHSLLQMAMKQCPFPIKSELFTKSLQLHNRITIAGNYHSDLYTWFSLSILHSFYNQKPLILAIYPHKVHHTTIPGLDINSLLIAPSTFRQLIQEVRKPYEPSSGSIIQLSFQALMDLLANPKKDLFTHRLVFILLYDFEFESLEIDSLHIHLQGFPKPDLPKVVWLNPHSTYFSDAFTLTLNFPDKASIVQYLSPAELPLHELPYFVFDLIKRQHHPGNIVIFLSTALEVERAFRLLKGHRFPKLPFLVNVFSLLSSSELENSSKKREFLNSATLQKCNIILSITESAVRGQIQDVCYVIDYGFQYFEWFDFRRFHNVYNLSSICKREATKRLDMISTHQKGICFRLYSPEEYQDFSIDPKKSPFSIHPLLLCLKLDCFGVKLEEGLKLYLRSKNFSRIIMWYKLSPISSWTKQSKFDLFTFYENSHLPIEWALAVWISLGHKCSHDVVITASIVCCLHFRMAESMGYFKETIQMFGENGKLKMMLDHFVRWERRTPYLMDDFSGTRDLCYEAALTKNIIKRAIGFCNKSVQMMGQRLEKLEDVLSLTFLHNLLIVSKKSNELQRVFPLEIPLSQGIENESIEMENGFSLYVVPEILFPLASQPIYYFTTPVDLNCLKDSLQFYKNLSSLNVSLVKYLLPDAQVRLVTEVQQGKPVDSALSKDFFELTYMKYRVCLDELGRIINLCSADGYVSLIIEASKLEFSLTSLLSVCSSVPPKDCIPMFSLSPERIRYRLIFNDPGTAKKAQEIIRKSDLPFIIKIQPGAFRPCVITCSGGYYARFFWNQKNSFGKATIYYTQPQYALTAVARTQDLIVQRMKVSVSLQQGKCVIVNHLPALLDVGEIYHIFRKFGVIHDIYLRRPILNERSVETLQEHISKVTGTKMKVDLSYLDSFNIIGKFQTLEDLVWMVQSNEMKSIQNDDTPWVKAERAYEMVYNISNRLLNYLQDSIVSLLNEVREEKIYVLNFKLCPSEPGSPSLGCSSANSSMKYGYTRLLLQAAYLQDLVYVDSRLQSILTPEPLLPELPNLDFRLLFSKDVRVANIMNMAKKCSLFLDMDRYHHTVQMYGTHQSKERFKSGIQCMFEEFRQQERLLHQEDDYLWKCNGDEEDETLSYSSEAPLCPVCFCPTRDVYYLSHCRHRYCRKCILHLLESSIQTSSLPILCCACNSPVAFRDIRNVVPMASIYKLVEHSMDRLLQDDPSHYKRCPQATCQRVINVEEELQRHSATLATHAASRFVDQRMRTVKYIDCPGCRHVLCTGCWRVCHIGQTCEEFSVTVQEEDSQTKCWKQIHTKTCGCCGASIEKYDGCDHVICYLCKSDMCWVCGQMFKDAASCYNHIQHVHQ